MFKQVTIDVWKWICSLIRKPSIPRTRIGGEPPEKPEGPPSPVTSPEGSTEGPANASGPTENNEESHDAANSPQTPPTPPNGLSTENEELAGETTPAGVQTGTDVPVPELNGNGKTGSPATNSQSNDRSGGKSPHPTPGRRTQGRGDSGGSRVRTPPGPGAELICRQPRGSSQWEMVLSVPQECKITQVMHNDCILAPENNEYRPPDFSGKLSVQYEERSPDDILLFEKEGPRQEPLIFKLLNNWNGSGRKTRSITQGYFIVIAPRQWIRSGHVSIKPEECTDRDYQAHYFFKSKDGTDNETGGFVECPIISDQSGFNLEGRRVLDDSGEGELFVGAVPKLIPMVPDTNDPWVRVGEEKTDGWRGQNFKLTVQSLEEILGCRQGRFYLRIYDSACNLFDSGEFRYFKNLQEILVNDRPYSPTIVLTPSTRGYLPTTLQFIDPDMGNLHPKPKTNNSHAIIRQDGRVILKPCPEADQTTWILESEAGSVEVIIKLPRIWWKIADPDIDKGDWCDNPIRLSRNEFHDLRRAHLEILLPFCIKQLRAGFNDNLDQIFPARRTEGNRYREVNILLGNFIDYEAIEMSSTKDVYFRIEWEDSSLNPICISGEHPLPPPEPLSNPSPDGPIASKGDPDTGLWAKVKCSGEVWRRGKGFSHGELLGANLSPTDMRNISIQVDKRRRSVHDVNVIALNEAKTNAKKQRRS